MQAHSSNGLAYVLYVLHKNVNTVTLICEIIVLFVLSAVIWTFLELRVMSGPSINFRLRPSTTVRMSKPL